MATSRAFTGYQWSNFSNKTVANGTTVVLGSLTLSRGVWIVEATHQWSTSFNSVYIDELQIGTSVDNSSAMRGNASSGGGMHMTRVFNITSERATIYYRTYQGSGSSRDTRYTNIWAVRVA